MIVTNNYVIIPFTNEDDDVEFYDEDKINERFMMMNLQQIRLL